jgi:hypothetical protein
VPLRRHQRTKTALVPGECEKGEYTAKSKYLPTKAGPMECTVSTHQGRVNELVKKRPLTVKRIAPRKFGS